MPPELSSFLLHSPLRFEQWDTANRQLAHVLLSRFAAKKSNTWDGLLSNPFWKSEHVMSIEFHFLSPMVVLSSKKPNQMVKLAFAFLEAISLCSHCVFLSVFPVLISEKDFVRHFHLQLKFNDILRYVPTLLLIYGSVISTWTYWTY